MPKPPIWGRRCRARIAVGALAITMASWGARLHAAELLTYQGGAFTGGDIGGLPGYDYSSIANTYQGNPYSDPIATDVGAGADLFDSSLGTALETYCVDVGHYLVTSGAVSYNTYADDEPTTIGYFGTLSPNGTAAQQTAAGTSIVQELEHLASNWLGQVDSADSSAAFQIATWDIAFSNGLTTSTFTSKANGADAATVNGLVALYLGNLNGSITDQLVFLQDSAKKSQNLITFTPVPLPAAGWLMLSGLSGLLGAMRGWRR